MDDETGEKVIPTPGGTKIGGALADQGRWSSRLLQTCSMPDSMQSRDPTINSPECPGAQGEWRGGGEGGVRLS